MYFTPGNRPCGSPSSTVGHYFMEGWESSTHFGGWLRSFNLTTTLSIGLIRLCRNWVTSPTTNVAGQIAAGEAVGDPMTVITCRPSPAQIFLAFGLAPLDASHIRMSRGRAFASGELVALRWPSRSHSWFPARSCSARSSGPVPREESMFVCYAALLGVVWSIFASLALYVDGVLITADSTYWCLLIVSAVLAIVAEARLLLGRPGSGRRAAGNLNQGTRPISHRGLNPDADSCQTRGILGSSWS